ncbi:MAG: NAD(P)-dependent glycerol-3-phosphate dehydrogenase [Alphaproteobacteria bacterium]|nr:NAD(P)-dependent glycerol-3-phosphate dehydrogenase [Alphaproteobacteria bacterium]
MSSGHTLFDPVGVLGAGAWGTALALVAARGGHKVRLWVREADILEGIADRRENARFLPGIALPEAIEATGRLEHLAPCRALLMSVPAQFAREWLVRLAAILAPGTPVILCAKGIERATGLLMSEMLREAMPGAIPAVLSGPSFAADVAKGLPTAITLATADEELGRSLLAAFGQPAFRPYLSSDILGAEMGGAVKNVLAIACGIAEGKGLGESARAALMTRGFAEMRRFAVALGAREETLMGLCGLGDLILTCSSRQSRNFQTGLRMAGGTAGPLAFNAQGAVAEGVETAPALLARARRHGVEMPICEAVANIIEGREPVDAAIAGLLARPFKQEY